MFRILALLLMLLMSLTAHAQRPPAPTCEEQLATRVEQAQTLVEAWAQAQDALRQRWSAHAEALRAQQAADAATIAQLRANLKAAQPPAKEPADAPAP